MNLLARHALDHPRLWLLMIGLLSLLLGVGLLRLEIRTDGSALYPVRDPVIEAAEIDRLRFLDPRQTVLLVSAPPSAASLVSPDGFRFLRQLHRDLRSVSAVRAGSIVSVAGLPRFSEDTSGLSLGTYLDEIPEEAAAFATLVAQLRDRPLTDGLLLSGDGRLAAFYLPLSEDRPVAELVELLESWLSRYESAPFELNLTGPQVAESWLGRMVLRDLALFVPVMVAVVGLLLLLTLGNLGGVLVPLAEALVVLVWVFGLMGWLGVPLTLVTTILPVVLMAMAITDEIHLLERVQGHLRQRSLRESVEAALSDVGRPIIATSITTGLGFLSFLSSSVIPLRQFGLFTALGILLAMLLSFCWIPALIVSLPRGWFLPRAARVHRAVGASTRGWLLRRPGLAFGMALLGIAASAPGLLRLDVQDAWVDNFAPDSPLVVAEQSFNRSFWGSYRFDVVFESAPEFFYGPDGAALMQEFRELALRGPHVGGVTTYLDPLEEVARALGAKLPLSSMAPARLADVATVAEMSESRLSLRALLTDRGDAARARLFANRSNYLRARELRDDLEARLPPLVERYGVAYHYSGDLPVALAVVDAVVFNQLRSIGWALVTVTLVLTVGFARGWAGLIAMAPVAAALVLLFGGMGYAGLHLGVATSMFASLTVGIGVDFGIHFLHTYQRERAGGSDWEQATRATLVKTGRALRWNALVLGVGFLVLTLSSLKPNHSLGLLLAAAMLACYASTLLLLPRLLQISKVGLVLLLFAGPVLAASSAAGAAASRCPVVADPEALALMSALERDFRGRARVTRMEIRTAYGKRHPLYPHYRERPNVKVLWGVSNGESEETWLLWVFSGPGRMAGTTLLMRDPSARGQPDAMWLYLRSFDVFKKLSPDTQRVMVPGTALSYEDSRGFIPVDKYAFGSASAEPMPSAAKVAGVLACPRTASIREQLGYDSLALEIDRQKRLVRRVEYVDLGGRALKTYVLLEEIELAGLWLPQLVRMVHRTDGYFTDIGYEYWLLREPPPAALFEPGVAGSSFLERLQTFLAQVSLGERIAGEIEAANQQFRDFEERLRKREAGRPKSSHQEPVQPGP